MRNGDVLGDIRYHCNALLNILVQEIGAQLGVQNTAGQQYQRHDQQNGNEGDEQIGNDQPVPQSQF